MKPTAYCLAILIVCIYCSCNNTTRSQYDIDRDSLTTNPNEKRTNLEIEQQIKDSLRTNIQSEVLAGGTDNENPCFTLQNNPNMTLELINNGILDAVSTATHGETSLPDKVGLVYPDGQVKILSINEFKNPNGQRF